MPEPVHSLGGGALLKVAEAAANDLYTKTVGITRKSLEKLLIEFGVGFKIYVDRHRSKCKFVKTLLHRVDPISIETAYVHPSLAIRKRIVSGKDFLSELVEVKNIVIVGTGGSGKSMFMKNTFLELCEQPFGRIPLFIELRELNGLPNNTLFNHIYNQWSALIPSFTADMMAYGLRSGKFILLLDGLDEIDYRRRDEYCEQILEMAYRYPGCFFVVTSRPDESRFASWNEFYVGKILPLSQEQTISLIEKTDFDPDTKTGFLKGIRGALYETHSELLSSPLLCTMMLMTYSEFEEIPAKIHIFYERAFDALFSRHDRMKPFFKRKFYTTLAEDDFRRVFSTFCLFSYLSRMVSFEESIARDQARSAIQFDRFTIRADDFLRDLHESVSILLKEGSIYSFIHRSFQEYFVAVFLAERQIPKCSAFLIASACIALTG